MILSGAVSEIVLRCAGCGRAEEAESLDDPPWAICDVGPERYHFCPACWREAVRRWPHVRSGYF